MSPMMSIVGGDFTGQAAAAAAALGVQPGTLIATNTNNLYGFAHMGGLQQQLLQQSAAATVFQNYAEVMDGDDGNNAGVTLMGVGSAAVDDDQQVYGQLEDGYDDGGASGGMSDLETKQEIINIDDFVMMNEDNNSYDGTDFMTSSDKDISQSSSSCMTSMPNHDLLVPLGDGLLHHKLLGTTHAMINQASTSLTGMTAAGSGNGFANILIAGEETTGTPPAKAMRPYSIASGSCKAGNSGSGSGSSSSMRAQRKTRKIEPVNRPGLVLKTPIAYKGNIDPSVIPIQKDGMGMFSLTIILHDFLLIIISRASPVYISCNFIFTHCLMNFNLNLGLFHTEKLK